MLQDMLHDKEFSDMMEKHIKSFAELLIQKGENFSILTNITNIGFEPPLPKSISSTFKPITLFVLAGYTFESLSVDKTHLSFEAGFGSENIGSLVSVPLSSILQIIVEETPILINLAAPQKKKEGGNGVKKSMNIFLSNPENENLIKK